MILRSMLACIAMLSVLAAQASPVWAQKKDDERPAVPSEGSEVFAYVLNVRGYTAVSDIWDRKDTLLILFGKLDTLGWVNERFGGLREFQRSGGSVLLASDYPQDLPEYGVGIADGNGQVGYDPRYRETPLCPLIKALEAGAPASFGPLARGLATNRPAYFRKVVIAGGRRPPALQPLAGFNSFWRITQSGQLKDIRREMEQQKHHVARPNGSLMLPYAYLADSEANFPGRALLIAGHGCFTNEMLLQQDNDNFPFAIQCLDWLGKRPDGKQRQHALFIVDGKVVKSFDVGLRPPPLPLPPIPRPSIAVVNELLHGIEKEGLLFRVLDENFDVRVAVRVGLLVLTVLLLCYGAKKLAEQRHHSERGSALLAGPYAVPPDTSPLLAQRARSQIDRNALGAEARALVRAWFLETCGIPIDAWERTPGAPAPDAQLAGGWWQRYRVRRQVDRLKRLAGPSAPAPLSWTELVRLTKTLHALAAAVQQGRLRFAGCSPGENS